MAASCCPLGVLGGHPITPFLAQGLDEPLGLAGGTGWVGPGAAVLEAPTPQAWANGFEMEAEPLSPMAWRYSQP